MSELAKTCFDRIIFQRSLNCISNFHLIKNNLKKCINSVSCYNVDFLQNQTLCVCFLCINYSFYVFMKSLSLSLIATRVTFCHISVLMLHCLTCLLILHDRSLSYEGIITKNTDCTLFYNMNCQWQLFRDM